MAKLRPFWMWIRNFQSLCFFEKIFICGRKRGQASATCCAHFQIYNKIKRARKCYILIQKYKVSMWYQPPSSRASLRDLASTINLRLLLDIVF
jgi:hypothetical protein